MNEFKFKFNLQMFNIEGAPPQGGSVNQPPVQGTPPTETPTQQTPPMFTPPAGNQLGNQQTVQRPDGHVIRSVLQQAEQTFRQQNAHLFEIEQILREQGYDPQQVVAEYRRTRQEAERQARTGNIDPQLANYLRNLEGQLGQMQQFIQTQQRREAMAAIERDEQKNTELGKKYGIEYDAKVKSQVRAYAAQNNLSLTAAFAELFLDQIATASSQQAQGQQLMNLQGRGQQAQPVSSAAPGIKPNGPIDWRTVSRADYLAARERFRNGS